MVDLSQEEYDFMMRSITLEFMLNSNSPASLIDRKIAFEFLHRGGKIPAKYPEAVILSLGPEHIKTFTKALLIPDKLVIDNQRLVNILKLIGAISAQPEQPAKPTLVEKNLSEPNTEESRIQDEYIFIVHDEHDISLIVFDAKSTPKSELILKTYEKIRNPHSDYRVLGRGQDFINDIIALTVESHVTSSLYVAPLLQNISEEIGQPITIQELGSWREVRAPYRNLYLEGVR